ncbi:hypothetical protein ABXV18_24340, partial [Vibrio owensii]|uniref:hypothetical protein n=1 Tax=Vibrio owensii TaxID=696485 RepID=UPI00339AD071
IAIGTSDQAADLADETLVAEISRKVAVYAHTPGEYTFSFTTTFPPEAESQNAIKEAGVLNASSGGILFDRVTFGVINKGAEDSLTIQFNFSIT